MITEPSSYDDGLPLVGEDHGNRGLWIGLGSIATAGVVLFMVLESNRVAEVAPQAHTPRDFAMASAPGPELLIPQDYAAGANPAAPVVLRPIAPRPDAVRRPVRAFRAPPFAATPRTPTASYGPVAQAQPPAIQTPAPDPGRSAPVIVYDAAQPPIASASTSAGSGSPVQASRAIAVRGGDQTFIVAQGTLLSAVLETAIDSTQSGQVRALISTDVRNTQGSRILIPKGSRIFGEYKGDLGSGQNRAQIIWTRLVRPDGVTVALDSPASDQLGRAGVKGRVDTHFGERLLNALLQSSIDFGALAASRAVSSNNGVVIALPATVQGAGSQIIQPPPKPTLRVKHGTRISVFVARDLDFSGVD